MLVFANEGMVTSDAERAFAEALKLDAKNDRAKFYYDMALKQEGKLPASSDEQIAAGQAKAPALSDEQMAAGQAMSTQDQTAMIAGMMDGLEQKLGNNSRDLEGWKRLIRARRISNEIDKAKISLNLAMNIFKDEPAALDALTGPCQRIGDQLMREFKLTLVLARRKPGTQQHWATVRNCAAKRCVIDFRFGRALLSGEVD